MKILYSDDEEMFLVKKHELTNDYYLVVIVGGIGMYEVERKMDSGMVDVFHRNPKDLLSYVREIRYQA